MKSAAEFFALMDTLGLPDLSRAPVVAVTDYWGEELGRNTHYGFLLSDDGDAVTWLTTALQTLTAYRIANERQNRSQVEIWDFVETMNRIVAQFATNERTDAFRWSFWHLPRTDCLILAWIANQRGLPTLGESLVAIAQQEERQPHELTNLWLNAVGKLAQKKYSDIILSLQSRYVSYQEILDRLNDISARFPTLTIDPVIESWYASRRKIMQHRRNHFPDLARIDAQLGFRSDAIMVAVEHHSNWLRKAIADEQTHVPSTDRIAELIYQLRWQTGWQCSDTGHCDIFSPRSDDEPPTPAHELFAIGLPAVPQLIAALTDEHLTRAATAGRTFYFSHTFYRVGDCALQILERLAGRTFCECRGTGWTMMMHGDPIAVQRAAQQWWDEFSTLGECATLVATVRADKYASSNALQQLADKYPNAVLDAVAGALAINKNSYHLGFYLQPLARLPAAEVVPWALKLIPSLGELGRQIALVDLLAYHGSDAGFAWLTERLSQTLAREDFHACVPFIALRAPVMILQRLQTLLPEMDVFVRKALLDQIDYGQHFPQFTSPLLDSPELNHARDALLVQMFMDVRALNGGGTSHGRTQSNPRICDLAGQVLSNRWEVADQFPLVGSIDECDEQLARLQTWFRERYGALP